MYKIVFIIFSLLISTTTFSQVSPQITISKEKINESGVIKYVHNVKQGETLYSLSKAYNVTTQVIIENNPSLKNGLKSGMIIFIPVQPTATTNNENIEKESSKQIANSSKSIYNSNNSNSSSNNSSSYNSSNNSQSYNSKSSSNNSYSNKNNSNVNSNNVSGINNFINKITGKNSTNNKKATVTSKKYKKHTRKWYESLDDIALKYNVPADAIYHLNNLTTTELSKRQQLLIPDKEYVDSFLGGQSPEPEENIAENEFPEEEEKKEGKEKKEFTGNNELQGSTTNGVLKYSDPKYNSELDSAYNTDSVYNAELEYRNNIGTPLVEQADLNRELKISMILPINGDDTLNTNKNFVEFYAGALLAIDTLKYSGANINLTLIDQKLGSARNALELTTLQDRDLIIGPVINNDVKEIANIADSFSIPLVSPMDMSAEALLPNNKNLAQAPTLSKAQLNNIIKELYRDITSTNNNNNVVLCYEQWGKDTAIVRETKELLDSLNIEYKTISYTILEGRGISKEMRVTLSDTLSNYIVIPSNNEGFVNDAVRNIALVSNSFEKRERENNESVNFSINLYGMPRWRSFETIEPEIFHKMSLKLSLPYYVNYSSNEVKHFLLKYRALFNAEPTPYAYQGYDIAKYFITMVQKYGKEFIQAAELPKESMLQSNYNLKRESNESGLGNHATRTIRYNKDFTITVE